MSLPVTARPETAPFGLPVPDPRAQIVAAKPYYAWSTKVVEAGAPGSTVSGVSRGLIGVVRMPASATLDDAIQGAKYVLSKVRGGISIRLGDPASKPLDLRVGAVVVEPGTGRYLVGVDGNFGYQQPGVDAHVEKSFRNVSQDVRAIVSNDGYVRKFHQDVPRKPSSTVPPPPAIATKPAPGSVSVQWVVPGKEPGTTQLNEVSLGVSHHPIATGDPEGYSIAGFEASSLKWHGPATLGENSHVVGHASYTWDGDRQASARVAAVSRAVSPLLPALLALPQHAMSDDFVEQRPVGSYRITAWTDHPADSDGDLATAPEAVRAAIAAVSKYAPLRSGFPSTGGR
jgi:hypothetical protein